MQVFVNQFWVDLINWLRHIFYIEDADVRDRPFTIIESFNCRYGVLSELQSNNDMRPREVLTFRYRPAPVANHQDYSSTTQFDYYILLEHLWAIAGHPDSKRSREYSHHICILKCPRFIYPHEAPEGMPIECLFEGVYDLFKPRYGRDFFAKVIVRSIAVNRLCQFGSLDFPGWDSEIVSLSRQHLGLNYHPKRIVTIGEKTAFKANGGGQ